MRGHKMVLIMYGTCFFAKFVAYYGNKKECSKCHKVYQKSYVKNTVWGI